MPVKQPGARHLALVGLGAVVPLGIIAKMVFDAGGLSYGLQLAAFFLGAGGMMLMFHRWRLHGDTRARVLVLIAFAIWAIAVGVASVTDSGTRLGGPGSWVAGLALLVGFVGGVITLLSTYHGSQKNDDLAPPTA